MLVLKRRQGESILIGDAIEIEVVEISAGRVKLGIKAPPEVMILRSEVHQAGQENVAAARGIDAGIIADLVRHLRSN